MAVAVRPQPLDAPREPELRSLQRRGRRLSPALVLAVALAGAAAARLALAWLRATPNYFPDEYIYSQLGRSIADGGRPLIRGGAAHFPALLQPILTAPAWLFGDVATAYRLVQAIDVLAMTLAAVPVYLLARRLRLDQWVAVAVSVLSLALPDLLYASMNLSEAIAYPLVLGAAAAGVATLERPTARSQGLFLVLCLLATFARIQFALLLVVYVVAAFVVALAERRVRAVLREQRLPLAVVSAVVAAGAAYSLTRSLGYYPSFLHLNATPLEALKIAGVDVLVMLYDGGWVLAPGVLLGLFLVLRGPRTRAELAFVSFALPFAAGLFAQAAAYGDPRMPAERYLFYALPIATLCFALYAKRGWPHRLAFAAIAAGQAAIAAMFPLSGWAVAGINTHSPFLFAVHRLELATGIASGSALVALGATACSVGVVAASLRPRLATWIALSLAFAVCVIASAGAYSYDLLRVGRARTAFLPHDRSWIDHARVGRVPLVLTPGGLSTAAFDEMFWNRSLDRVVLLPGTLPPDAFAVSRAGVTRNGTVHIAGKPLRGAFVLDEFGVTARFRDAHVVRRGTTMSLWRASGPVQLSLLAYGRSYDGWLGSKSEIAVWPRAEHGRVAGWVTFTLRPPAGGETTFRFSGGMRLHLDRERSVRLRACAAGPWALTLDAQAIGLVDIRSVAARMTMPRFRPDPRACTGRSGSSA